MRNALRSGSDKWVVVDVETSGLKKLESMRVGIDIPTNQRLCAVALSKIVDAAPLADDLHPHAVD